jgi:hypothetical protein
MRPLLFQVPLPALRLSLWPALLGAAVVVAIFTLLAFREARGRERQRALVPGAIAASLVVGAFLYRDRALVVKPIEVGGFGVMLALSLGLGVWLTQRAAERGGMSRVESASVCGAVAVSGIVGARLGHALLHPSDFGSVLGVLAFFDGGLVLYGALAFGVVAAFVESRRRSLAPLAWLDAASAGLAVGIVLTRFGCWLEGCDFGRPLGAEAPRFLARVGRSGIDADDFGERAGRTARAPGAALRGRRGRFAGSARVMGRAAKAEGRRLGSRRARRLRSAPGARRFRAPAVAGGVARPSRGGRRTRRGGCRAFACAAPDPSRFVTERTRRR